MDKVIFAVMTYLPVASGGLGVVFLSVYLYNSIIKKKNIPIFLIVGCLGIGILLLCACAFFLIGLLGLGPVPN